MQKVIHGPGGCLVAVCLYLKHHLRWNIYHQHTSCPADLQWTAGGVWLVWSQDLTYWFSRNQTQRLSWHRFIYLFLRTCTTARSQLVWDMSVFVFEMEHLVAPFCYLRSKAVMFVFLLTRNGRKNRSTCLRSVLRTRQGTAWVVFPSRTAGKDGILPGWRSHSSSYLFWGPACASAAGSAVIGRCVTSGAGFARNFAWTASGTLRQDGVIYLHSYIPDAYSVT